MMGLDINDFRGILTAVIFAAFIGISLWAFSRRAKPGFDASARIPLEDDNNNGESKS